MRLHEINQKRENTFILNEDFGLSTGLMSFIASISIFGLSVTIFSLIITIILSIKAKQFRPAMIWIIWVGSKHVINQYRKNKTIKEANENNNEPELNKGSFFIMLWATIKMIKLLDEFVKKERGKGDIIVAGRLHAALSSKNQSAYNKIYRNIRGKHKDPLSGSEDALVRLLNSIVPKPIVITKATATADSRILYKIGKKQN